MLLNNEKNIETYPANKGHEFTFYCDLETTGTDPVRHDVIEICIDVCRAGSFDLIDRFHTFVQPPQINSVTWDKRAQAVHGIPPEKCREFTPRRQVAIDLLVFLKNYKHNHNWPQLFICHALPKSFYKDNNSDKVWAYFDYWFIYFLMYKEKFHFSWEKVFSENYLLSTIELDRKAGYGKEPRFDENNEPVLRKDGRQKTLGNGLAVCAERINFPLKHHGAISDTEATRYLHRFLHTGEKYNGEK